jgi:putative addiction module component (TIGR02574 family)
MGISRSDLAGLSLDEKLELISDLWDSIESPDGVPLSDEQNRELFRRRAEGLGDPSAMIDWPSVRQELRKKP